MSLALFVRTGARHAVGQRDRGLLGLLASDDLPQPVVPGLAPSARADLCHGAQIKQPAQIPVGSPALSDGSRSRAHSWRCAPAVPCHPSSAALASDPTRRTDPWRKGWDSNPRTLSGRWFSRPVQSTTLPPFRRERRADLALLRSAIADTCCPAIRKAPGAALRLLFCGPRDGQFRRRKSDGVCPVRIWKLRVK